MGTLINLVMTFGMAYLVYRQAKKSGMWSWKLFGGLVGSIAAFGGFFMAPLMYSNLSERHPQVFLVVLFGGIALFAGGMIVFALRAQKRMKQRLGQE